MRILPSSAFLSKYGHFWLQKQDGDGRNAKFEASKQYSTNRWVMSLDPQSDILSMV